MIYKKDYYGFVYIWFDKKRKMFLIGSHHGSINDSYITSTGGLKFKRVFNKRPDTFKRKILEYNTSVDNFKYTQGLEQKWLDYRPGIALDKKYYNQKQWATGGIDKIVPRTKPESWKRWKSEDNLLKARNKIHPFQNIKKSKVWVDKHKFRMKKLVEEGIHNFTSEFASINANNRLLNGTHHFLKSDFNKKPFKLLKNGVEIGTFESKVEAVNKNWPAHLIDKLRKYGSYTIIRGSYRTDLYKPGDYFEYKNQP